MKLSLKKVLGRGNESLAAGAIFSIASISCPCPTCIGASALCLLNSIREKLDIGLSDLPARMRKR